MRLAASDNLCVLGLDASVPLTGLMPAGVHMINTQQQQYAAANASSNSQAAESSYTAARSVTSLRAAAFGEDDSAANSAPAHPSAASDSEDNSVSQLLWIALICGLSLIALSLLLYRFLPARIALLVDRFSWNHPAPVDGSLQRKPTQLGAAFTMAFAFSAVLLGLYLGLAPNVQLITTLVPPSATDQSGSATADMQITVRAFLGTAALNNGFCPAVDARTSSSLLSGTRGFKGTVTVRSEPAAVNGACVLAIDCLGCTLIGAESSLTLQLPYSAQLLEWEVQMTAAATDTASRLYGAITQRPGELLDAQGQLEFGITESFYSDTTVTPEVRGSGYELDFQTYSTVQPQSVNGFSSASRVGLAFVFNKSPVVFITSQSVRLSLLQVLASVLSAVVSLLGLFGVAFALTVNYGLPLIHIAAGHVVDQRKKGGQLFIREDATNNQVTKYKAEGEEEEEEEGEHGAADSKPRLRVTTRADKPRGEQSQQRQPTESEELELAPLPQLVPPSPSGDGPGAAAATINAAESPLLSPASASPASPILLPAVVLAAAAATPALESPSRAGSVQWQMAGSSNEGTTDAAASSSADDGAPPQDGFHRPALGPTRNQESGGSL
jgi:hypothetical protein